MATKKKTGSTSTKKKRAPSGRQAPGRSRGGSTKTSTSSAAGSSRPSRKRRPAKTPSRDGGEQGADASRERKRSKAAGSSTAARSSPSGSSRRKASASRKSTKKREDGAARPKRVKDTPSANRTPPVAQQPVPTASAAPRRAEPSAAPPPSAPAAAPPPSAATPAAAPPPSAATPAAAPPPSAATPAAAPPPSEASRAAAPAPAPEERDEPSAPSAVNAALDEATDPSVAAQIRDLEARLGGMIRDAEPDDSEEPPASLREQVSFAAREVVDRLAAPVERPGQDDGGVVDAVRGLLSSDYYLRQWGRLGMRNRSEEVDDFGLDTVYERRLRPLWDFLYKRYFRVEVEGIENVPSEGRCLIVANHSGTLPLDGVMLRACMRIEHPAARELRWLSEDFIYHLPFVGAFMSRIGAVRACQENAERLLSKDALVAVFPEGVKGIGKLYRDRYRLQRFGRGGFIRLCLRSQTPLVPCAVIGAEEASPMLYRDELLSRALGLPYLPVTPTFPWLGPAGLIPAPTKWRIIFGEPVDVSQYDPSAAEDHVLVARLSESVRTSIQQMLDVGVGQRRSVWGG
jgi:1-acyl-sn-glycerol-3-phosphate acyltransferase